MDKLYIVMVGLPARGKSTLAHRLCEGFLAEGIQARLFNNGELRRSVIGPLSSDPEFYRPGNETGRRQRERLAQMNAEAAQAYLLSGGQVAILDATNVSKARRVYLQSSLSEAPLLFIECVNDDPELLATTVRCKAKIPEFSNVKELDAVQNILQRIDYYAAIYVPLTDEAHFMRVDTLRNLILFENAASVVPYYLYIRSVIVSDLVRGLYLARHAESVFNIEGRIGGDPALTERGRFQADCLADYFSNQKISYIFSSRRKRSLETVQPLLKVHQECIHLILPELDEIDAGICEGMSYGEIHELMPKEYVLREKDKYNYVYPFGEGYSTMRERVERGLRKALFLSGGKAGMLIVGHQAVNRMILSLFLFQRTKDVPYIFVPQTQFFFIEATHRRKLIELIRFMPS